MFIIKVTVPLQWIYGFDVLIRSYLHCTQDDVILETGCLDSEFNNYFVNLLYVLALCEFPSLKFGHSLFWYQ